jgi:hypothetical protein
MHIYVHLYTYIYIYIFVSLLIQLYTNIHLHHQIPALKSSDTLVLFVSFGIVKCLHLFP